MRTHIAAFVTLVACSGESPVVVDAARAGDATADLADIAAPPDVPDVARDSSGATCSFNRDCPEGERCECSETLGCRCLLGARGTGRVGVDRCFTGNDCESALCVEANGGVSLCSDACMTAGDCPTALPRCVAVPTVGRFCARDPSATGDASVADAPPGCMGDCARTTLQATFGTRRGAFERAQHGNAGFSGLHVEAHSGGDPMCPNERSPTPRRSLVITGLRATADATPQTEAEGVRASLLDFGGDLVDAPVVRATAVRAVPRAWMRDGYVSLELTATFPGGTVTGTLFAPHCASLDGM